MVEALVTIPLLTRAASLVLPLAATYCKHLLGDDKSLLTQLIETCIEEAEDAGADRLEEALKKKPDLVLALNRQVFLRYTGWVLGALIRQFGALPQFAARQPDFERFADQAPDGFIKFVMQGSPGLSPVQQDVFLRQMAESLARGDAVPPVSSVPFITFFKWHIHLPPEIYAKLDAHIQAHFENALQVLLLRDDPEAAQAYKQIVLHGLTGIQREVRHIQEQLRQHGELLEDLRDSPGFDLPHYARKLAMHCERIPFSSRAENKGTAPITLSAIFVEPDVRPHHELDTRPLAANRDVLEALRHGTVDKLSPEQQEIARALEERRRESPPRPAFATLLDPSVSGHIILAHAGVGKSSLVRRMALRWASQITGGSQADTMQPLPLLIELKSFASAYGKDPTLTLLGFLHGCEQSLDRLDRVWCLHYLRTGAALLILDGLDEVIDHGTREAIANGASRLRRLGVRVWVTSRREGFIARHWQQQALPWSGWLLEEFSPAQRDTFIDLMLPRLWASEGECQSKKAELHRRIQQQTSLGLLSTNPLLLTLITVLQRTGRLGDNRLALYREAAELLLDQWEAEHFGADHVPLQHGIPCDAQTRREIVRRLALKLVGADDDGYSCFAENLFGLEIFEEAIREVVDPSGINPGAANMAAQHLPDYLNERHSVICYSGEDPETGERLFSFIHRTFLEYFIALGWVEEIDNENASDLTHCRSFLEARNEEGVPRWRDERFANILPFYFGMLTKTFQEKRLPLLLELIEERPNSAFPEAEPLLFAASVWGEIGHRDRNHPKFNDILRERLLALAEWIAEKLSDETSRDSPARWLAPVLSAMTQLFGHHPTVDAWLWGASSRKKRSSMLYSEVFTQLHALYGPCERLRAHLHEIATRPNEGPFSRHAALRAVDAYWGSSELNEVLLKLHGIQTLFALVLEGCTGLKNTSALAGLTNLIHLDLMNCTGLNGSDALAGIKSLHRLERLDLSGCTGLDSTTALVGLKDLKSLTLRNCTGLKGSGALTGLKGLSKLQRLDLDGCTELEDAADLAGLASLLHLDMRNCTGLTGVKALTGLRGLSKLQFLGVSGCTGLVDTTALAGLANLTSLDLSNCPGLKGREALAGLKYLRKLDRLFLNGCTGLDDTTALTGLTNLIFLNLSFCPRLKGINELTGLAGMQQLKILFLHGCTGLEGTSALAGLTGLKRLYLSNCTGLKGGDALVGMKGLRKLDWLDMSGCTGLEDTAPLAVLPALRHLNLSECTGLKGGGSLAGLEGLQELEWLSVSGCTGLEESDVRWLRKAVGEKGTFFGP